MAHKKHVNFARRGGHGDMRRAQMHLFTVTVASILTFAGLCLGSCSDSFLFGGKNENAAPVAPPLASNPRMPYAGPSYNNSDQPMNSGPTVANPGIASTFKIDSTNEKAIEVLFPGQEADPFDISHAGNQASLTLEIRSVKEDKQQEINYVKARLYIRLRLQDGSSLSRQYETIPGEPLELSNSGTKDFMKGRLKATDDSNDIVKILANREAVAADQVNAAQQAKVNPWAGSLSTEKDEKLGAILAVPLVLPTQD